MLWINELVYGIRIIKEKNSASIIYINLSLFFRKYILNTFWFNKNEKKNVVYGIRIIKWKRKEKGISDLYWLI